MLMQFISEPDVARKVFAIANTGFFIIVLAASSYVFLRSRKSFFISGFLIAGVSLALCLAALILKMNAPNEISLWLLVCLQYFALFCTCFFLLLFGISCYTGQPLPIRMILPVTLPFSVSFLLIVTNPLHEAFFYNLDIMDQQAGSLYYPVLALNFAFAIIGLFLGCFSIARNIRDHKLSCALLFTGTLLPAVFAAIASSQFFRFSYFLSPLLLIISLLIFGFIGLKYHFLDVTPLARHIIMNEISSALIIIRNDGRIIDSNSALTGIFNQPGGFSHLMPIKQLAPQLDTANTSQLPSHREITLETANGKRLFEMNIQPVIGRQGKIAGRVLRLLPLDQHQELRQLLARQNEQMEIANRELERYVNIVSELRSMMVRNRLAREMHDSLGHTLIILISVLERLLKASANEIEQELIHEAFNLMHQARSQLPQADTADEAPGNNHPDPAAQNLGQMIEKLSQDLSLGGVRLEKDLRGEIARIPIDHYPQLIQICREAITNAIKHGRADVVNIFILVGEKSYDLVILDNGMGNTNFSLGFGLRNMRRRAESMNGNMRAQGDSSGFGIYISIPMPEPIEPDGF